VTKLSQAGIVDGYGDALFCGDKTLSEELQRPLCQRIKFRRGGKKAAVAHTILRIVFET